MSDEPKKLTARQKRAALIVGVVLGIICHALPPHLAGPCQTILRICTGGL